jgi:hypothetical protein
MSGYNESAYKEARDSSIALPCPFERGLLSLCATCCKSRKLLLAEREAISCTEQSANERCIDFHRALHANARFALHIDPQQPWPFGKEIRAQCGGIGGLKEMLGFSASDDSGSDIASIVAAGIERYGSIAAFPYSEIMRAIVHYEPRKRRDGK